MDGQHILESVTVEAAAALTAQRFVTLAGAVPAANAGGVGVNQYDCASGDLARVATAGYVLVEASAAITLNAQVATTNDGRAVTYSTGAALGRAMDAATAAGQFIRVNLAPGA